MYDLSHCYHFTESVNIPTECQDIIDTWRQSKLIAFCKLLVRFSKTLSSSPILLLLVVILTAIVIYRIFTILLGLTRQIDARQTGESI